MELVKLSDQNKKEFEEFIAVITSDDTRPVIYVGMDAEGEPRLTVGKMTWRELAYVKACLDNHFIKDWLGVEE